MEAEVTSLVGQMSTVSQIAEYASILTPVPAILVAILIVKLDRITQKINSLCSEIDGIRSTVKGLNCIRGGDL